MRRFWLSSAAILIITSAASAQVFSSGNLVVYRVGDGSAALTNASTAVFLEQYTVGGTLVGSPIGLPTAGATAFTAAGNATSEGFMSLSGDGQFLVLPGYNVATGLTSVATSTGTAAPRSVGLLDLNASFTLSTLGTSAYSGGNIRSAYSTNGTDIWTSGSNQGVHYHVAGSGTTTGNLMTTPTNTRVTTVINGQLYFTSSSGAFVGFNSIGTGTPTTTGQTATNIVGLTSGTGTPSPYGVFALDNPLNPFAGIDTVYLADDRAIASGGGVQRWVFDGSSWTLSATANPGTGVRGLTASISGSTVTLYGISAEASANRLVTISDVLSPTGGTFDPGGFVTLATAPANTAYRSVAFAPVPEPGSILAVSAGALLFGRWVQRRRRKA